MINVCTRKSNRFSFLSLQIGPGIVYLTFHSPIGSGTFVQHLVPTEPLVQKLVHNLYFQKNLPAFIGKFFLLGEAIQVRYFFLKLGLTLFFRIAYLFLFAKKIFKYNWNISIKNYFLCLFQLERDIMIWNNKRYEKKPLFVKSKEDSQVAKHRRWFSQFYSENSPRLKFQRDTLEWWLTSRMIQSQRKTYKLLVIFREKLVRVNQNGIHRLQATIIETQPAIMHHVIFSPSFICSTLPLLW